MVGGVILLVGPVVVRSRRASSTATLNRGGADRRVSRRRAAPYAAVRERSVQLLRRYTVRSGAEECHCHVEARKKRSVAAEVAIAAADQVRDMAFAPEP